MKKQIPIVNYDVLSGEYYQEELHPTSNNFRAGSKRIFEEYFNIIQYSEGDRVVEAGAGKSLAAEWLTVHGHSLRRLIITDLHRSMLSYSILYEKDGAKLVVCAADQIYEHFSAMDLVVSSLGDPYNTSSFWESSYRAIRKDGHCIFTTPSYDWATQFRAESQEDDVEHAHFLMRDGREVSVPSMIYTKEEQDRMAEAAGFRLVRCDDVYVDQLESRISRKLFAGTDSRYPILTGYLFRRG